MESPLGPTLANAFLCFHEQIWLNEFTDELNLYTTEDKLMTYLFCFVNLIILRNSKIISILNIESLDSPVKKNNNSMPFLDILITRTSNGFKISVYHKTIFSGGYSNFNSFISKENKVGLIFNLLFWTFLIVSDFSRFHSEVCHLKGKLKKDIFPIKLIESCIKNFLNKRLAKKPDRKKDLVIPFLGKVSLDLRTPL